MQATGDTGTSKRLLSGILLSGGHETGHLVLGELDLATTESGQAEVGDLELLGGSTHIDGIEKRGGRWREREMCEGERKEGEQQVSSRSECAPESSQQKWAHTPHSISPIAVNCWIFTASNLSAPSSTKGLQLKHVA